MEALATVSIDATRSVTFDSWSALVDYQEADGDFAQVFHEWEWRRTSEAGSSFDLKAELETGDARCTIAWLDCGIKTVLVVDRVTSKMIYTFASHS
jgi:hypothetical protein